MPLAEGDKRRCQSCLGAGDTAHSHSNASKSDLERIRVIFCQLNTPKYINHFQVYFVEFSLYAVFVMLNTAVT